MTTPKGLLINLAIVAAIVTASLLVFFKAYLPAVTNHGESLTVPKLSGMSLEEMEDFLGNKKLRYEVVDSGYSSSMPPLTILDQYPEPGAKVKEKRKIFLTVKAFQPKSVKMPNLIDGSLKNAELVLKSYGLERGRITYKPDLAQNAVLQQMYNGADIVPGDLIKKGSVVDLIVGDGLGKRVFSAPNFVGLMLDEAEFAIRGAGLATGSVLVKIFDPEGEALLNIPGYEEDTLFTTSSGRIYKQFPSSGDNIRLGQQVDLWVTSFDREDSLMIVEGRLNIAKDSLNAEIN